MSYEGRVPNPLPEYPHWWGDEGKCEWCGMRSLPHRPLPRECEAHRQHSQAILKKRQ